MQPRLFIALPILLAHSACRGDIHAQDQAMSARGKIAASEANEQTPAEDDARATGTEHRDTVGID